ncbi:MULTISPECIES: FAD-dependent oxidoreductase [Metabacillus]|uniref:Glucose-inhibited division protein A n=2 Tax=Metabacillus TaxID=2675233 RepID=A0A179T3B3_9BACI|nr:MULTISPECIES: FAD-dependent oxidoreductase [Metabacillus]OAS87830.1 glucose-inhibited division protein A [Metabacillus litoralis]QNF27329.1 FAD-dependent oxidoreductase [Metabacillus sp. KUDC1714]
MKEFDVIILGGGISGAVAGIGSSRLGAKTLIVESHGFLGGMLTAAGVGPMMTFHAGKKQAIQGITDEIIQRLKKIGKSVGHIKDLTNYTYSITPFDSEAMKHELEMMLVESGAEILYHTVLAEVIKEGSKITKIKVCNKAGLSEISGKIFIDASGDGDLAAWSGVKFTKGRETDGASQPMTLKMKVRNVDINRVKQYIKENPENFTRVPENLDDLNKVERLSVVGYLKEFKEAKERGDITIKREDVLFFETNNPGEVIFNTTRLLGFDSTDPWSLSNAEIEGRKQCRELEYFMKNYMIGFENAVVVSTGPSIGVRSSRQIEGLYTLKAEDLLEQRKFYDVIAHSGYPIDIHSPDGEGTSHRKLEWGGIYGIPYRSLVSKEIDNLIVVGRCLSATFEAQAGVRTTPTAGAIGQAGGVAAAIAARENVKVQELNIKKLQGILQEQGAYLEIEPSKKVIN